MPLAAEGGMYIRCWWLSVPTGCPPFLSDTELLSSPFWPLCFLHSHCWESGLSSHWSFSYFLSSLGFNSFKMAKGLL